MLKLDFSFVREIGLIIGPGILTGAFFITLLLLFTTKFKIMLVRSDITLEVKNNRKKTRGRKFSSVKRKDGKTVKLQNVIVYTRVG